MRSIRHGLWVVLTQLNWPDLAGVHSEETIEEDENTNQGSRDQHAGVPAQPRKIKADFLTKVTPGKVMGEIINLVVFI